MANETVSIAANTATTRQDRSTSAIARAARATGMDFNYLLQQARIESGLNPDAKARTSSATGLYQFISQSWLGVVDKHGADHGLGWAAAAITQRADGRFIVADPAMRQAILDLRKNPDAAASMGAEFAADNKAYLEPRIGRNAAPVDLYLAHFLGPAGAAKFLQAHDAAPGACAAALFPKAAVANRAIFYDKNGAPRSLDAVRSRFAAKLGDGSATAIPAPDTDTTAEPAPNLVLPADYVRISEVLAARTQSGAGASPMQSAGFGAAFGPGEARLAYLLFASGGLCA